MGKIGKAFKALWWIARKPVLLNRVLSDEDSWQTEGTSRFNGKQLDLLLGCAFEKELTDRLYLRFQTELFTASYQRSQSRVKTADLNEKSKDRSIVANLALSPSVQLRLAL